MLPDLYAVTIFDRRGPVRFTKHVLASSERAASELAASLWSGCVERVEFECEVDASESPITEPSGHCSRTTSQEAER